MSSRYGDLIKQARNSETQKSRKLEEEVHDAEVNLSIKVPLSLRRHWAAEAKRQGATLTSVVIEALKRRFGEPN